MQTPSDSFIKQPDGSYTWEFNPLRITSDPRFFVAEKRALSPRPEFWDFLVQHGLEKDFYDAFVGEMLPDGTYRAKTGPHSINVPADIYMLFKLTFL